MKCKGVGFRGPLSGYVTWKRRRKTRGAVTTTIQSKLETFECRDSHIITSIEVPVADENSSGFYSCSIQFTTLSWLIYYVVESDETELCVYGRKCIDEHVLLTTDFFYMISIVPLRKITYKS